MTFVDLGQRLGGNWKYSPREIGARPVFKVSTEEIISRGESPSTRTGPAVVWGLPVIEVGLAVVLAHRPDGARLGTLFPVFFGEMHF